MPKVLLVFLNFFMEIFWPLCHAMPRDPAANPGGTPGPAYPKRSDPYPIPLPEPPPL